MRDCAPLRQPLAADARRHRTRGRNLAKHGFTISAGEWQDDVVAVGVPMLLRMTEPASFAFNCGAPAFRFHGRSLRNDIGPRLVAMVRNIEAALGGAAIRAEKVKWGSCACGWRGQEPFALLRTSAISIGAILARSCNLTSPRSRRRAPGARRDRAPLLAVRDVSVVFGGIIALNGVSFDMHEGLILGLIGPNGAGKTTLFNCLSRLYSRTGRHPDGGREHPDAAAAPDRRNRHRPHLPERRAVSQSAVLDNVRVGTHARTDSDIVSDSLKLPWVRRGEAELNKRVHEIISYLDLDDVAHARVSGLPFGTQKRVELARALAADPKILLLDEPAGGLNHEEVHVLGDLIRRIRDERNVTMLLVEHHMGLVMSIADHVVALNFGRKLAEGTPAQVQSDPMSSRPIWGARTNDGDAQHQGVCAPITARSRRFTASISPSTRAA